MRISDWSSDVCSSDLYLAWHERRQRPEPAPEAAGLADYGIDSVALNGETNDVPVSVAMGDTLDVDVRVRSNDARAPVVLIGLVRRSEERRVGNECVCTCSSRCAPYT